MAIRLLSRDNCLGYLPTKREDGKETPLGNLSSSKAACVIFVLCTLTAMASSAQTVESLASFNGTNGGNPVSYGSMVQGTNGNY